MSSQEFTSRSGDDKPVARLVPLENQPRRNAPGPLKGKLWAPADFMPHDCGFGGR